MLFLNFSWLYSQLIANNNYKYQIFNQQKHSLINFVDYQFFFLQHIG